jgi:hypothetical protein
MTEPPQAPDWHAAGSCTGGSEWLSIPEPVLVMISAPGHSEVNLSDRSTKKVNLLHTAQSTPRTLQRRTRTQLICYGFAFVVSKGCRGVRCSSTTVRGRMSGDALVEAPCYRFRGRICMPSASFTSSASPNDPARPPKQHAGGRREPVILQADRICISHFLRMWPRYIILLRASRHASNRSTILNCPR